MSLWAKVGVQIQDLNCFKAACDKNGVRFTECAERKQQFNGMLIVAELNDTQGYGRGYLCVSGGGYRMAMDTDASYNSLVSRLGRNADRLCRDYTQDMVTQGIRKKGGMINGITEALDGSVHIRATVM